MAMTQGWCYFCRKLTDWQSPAPNKAYICLDCGHRPWEHV